MSGIVNSTGARSGVIGTTVGTPVTDLSTATFPAGHIIQTIADTYPLTSQVNITTTSNDYLGTNLSVTITPNSTSNYLLCHLFISGLWITAIAENLMSGLQYSTDTFSSHSAILGEKEFFSHNLGYVGGAHSGGAELGLDGTQTLWAVVPTVSEITIRPRFGGYNNNEIGIGVNSSSAKGLLSLIVHEVQQ